MALTAAQLQTLRTAIDTDPTLMGYAAAGANADIQRYFNEDASPAVSAWQTVSSDDLIDAFDWTEIDALSAGTKDTLLLALSRSTHDARKQTVRDLFVNLLPTASQAAASAAAKRNATRAEALIGGAAVQGATVLDWEGTVTLEDVRKARAL